MEQYSHHRIDLAIIASDSAAQHLYFINRKDDNILTKQNIMIKEGNYHITSYKGQLSARKKLFGDR